MIDLKKMDSTNFPNVFKMLEIVAQQDEKVSFTDRLKNHMRANKYYPMLQMKKVFKSGSLILLHNTYKRSDVSHFKDLYEEARSVIIDVDKPIGENIVVSLADKIPESMTIDNYLLKAKDTDEIEKGFEGTMVYVYNHENNWFFGTSTIPDIDYSRYFHPTKTHGEMFDEILDKYGYNREGFVKCLSPNKAYGFLLVHYQNNNVMDYTEQFGENYKELFHIFSRDKESKGKTVDYTDRLNDLPVKYANSFSLEECIAGIKEDKSIYSFIVRTESGETYKVCRNEIFEKESKNRGNSNIWVNLIDVYMKGVPHYKVVDYICEYVPDNKEALTMTDDMGRTYEPTYMIHEAFRNISETLYRLYRTTTYYNKYTGRYNIMKEADSTLAPIMRFHLSQLRIIQITTHRDAPITPRNVRDYICHNQTMKNIRLLISHFAKVFSQCEQSKNYKSTMCFCFLNGLLSN